MQIVFVASIGDASAPKRPPEELDVVLLDPDATIGDLVSALIERCGADRPPVGKTSADPDRWGLEIDGHPTDDWSRPLTRSTLAAGAQVHLVTVGPAAIGGGVARPAARRRGAAPEGLALSVVGGLEAGARASLGPGATTLGRTHGDVLVPGATVSARHAVLEVGPGRAVRLADRSSLNGTWIGSRPVTGPVPLPPGSIIRLGATQLAVGPAPEPDRHRSLDSPRRRDGRQPFNRPPRPDPPPAPPPLAAPHPPTPAPASTPVGFVAVIAPLVMGLVMMKVFDSVMFGLFALLSPVMLVGSAIEGRRRRRLGTRRERRRFDADLAAFVAELEDRRQDHRRALAANVPDLAEVLRRCQLPSSRLWERRSHHADHLRLRLGIATATRWQPPVTTDGEALDAAAIDAVDDASLLFDAVAAIDLADGAVVGLVGNRDAALAVARSLVVQAATHHGPADLSIAVLTATQRRTEWDWAKWLPHTADPNRPGSRWLAAGEEQVEEVLRALVEHQDARGETPAATTLVVIDEPGLVIGHRSPARGALRSAAVAGLVIAPTADELPATCTSVVELSDQDGTAAIRSIGGPAGPTIDGLLACGLPEPLARLAARSLARYDDPELSGAGEALPASVALLPLLGSGATEADGLARRWAAAGPDPAPVAPLGMTEDGVLAIDLAADGPHALVAGTTGSGKSELLRTLVAGLAVACSPDHVNFVLIDFKGGSAFAECAALPHTVGFVTDLDQQGSERALRCLEAELRHRERRLRSAGVSDLRALRADPSSEPLPRLVVLIDEFATMKAELGGFVDSLIGIAQRGRSLGVHLVLATQRPSGSVDANIRANTNLRIALRVQSGTDSTDVIDEPAAAAIGRHQPGRALVRLGPGELIPLQTALATGTRSSLAAAKVAVRPFRFGPGGSGLVDIEPTGSTSSGDDLRLLVDAARAAHRQNGGRTPRRPWPDPLPADIDLTAVLTDPARPPTDGGAGQEFTFALADDPDRQTQEPAGWSPEQGNLLLIGIGGSGTTTACTSLVLALAAALGPDELHLHLVDCGAGDLAGLAVLPHVASAIATSERERQARLAGWLRAEVERRRQLGAERRDEPMVVVVLDGLAALRHEWADVLHGPIDALLQVYADGPELGIYMVVASDRAAAVPTAMQAVTRQRWLFRMADAHEYAAVGLSASAVPALGPGGALVAGGRQVQVARPAGGAAAAGVTLAGCWDPPRRPPPRIAALPSEVPLAVVAGATLIEETSWHLPLGLGSDGLEPRGFLLHPGEHALIAGPARSGRTTALATVMAVARDCAPTLAIGLVAGPRSSLGATAAALAVEPIDHANPAARLAALVDRGDPLLVLIDDAELLLDEDGRLADLLRRRPPNLHVVAAGRNESLRGLFTHWTRVVRQSRCALLLAPDLDLDGDLAGVTLPRRSIVPPAPGRGHLVEAGSSEIVQVAR